MENLIDKLYKKIHTGICVLVFPLISIVLQLEGLLGMLSLASLILLFIYLSYYSIFLFRTLPGRVPLITFCLGAFLTIGGSIADMFVTVLYTPDLAREGNYMVLMLLDFGASIPFIYLFMLFVQIIITILIVTLWGCFLKAYPVIIPHIPCKNLRTTFKWLLGAGKISILDWILLRKIDCYFSLSLMSFIFVVMQFFHWYAVLEWVEIIPISTNFRMIAITSVVSTAIMTLVYWTHNKLKQSNSVSPVSI